MAGLKRLLPGGAAVLLASAMVGFLMQAAVLPAPTGIFPVGTVTARLPPLASQERQTAFTAQVWYPAHAGAAGTALIESARVAWHGIRFDRRFRTAAMSGAPAAEQSGGFPLLIYVPEWGGARTSNIALAQDLASHGFVVAAMDLASGPAAGESLDFSSAAANAATLRLGDRLVRAQAHDAVELLDQLRLALGHDSALAPLSNSVDFGRVGIFGYSFGGAVAVQACWADRRFKAAIDMDGWLFGDAAEDGIDQPLMAMSDDTPLPGAAQLQSTQAETRFTAELNLADDRRTVAILARHGGERITIRGARHANFSDMPLIWPIRRMVAAGPVSAPKAHGLISAYAVAFFQKHLRGEDPPLLRPGAAPLDGVRLERWAAAALP